jgi:hypothetical protein
MGAGSAPRTGRERYQTMTRNLRDSIQDALREVQPYLAPRLQYCVM